MASQSITVNELLERNKAVAAKHEPIPRFDELACMGVEPPHLAIVTCADPRCNPQYYLDLKPSDMIVCFRNVNGHITAIISDIVALDQFLGIHDIMIVHHTDCGALRWTNEQVRAALKQRLPDNEEIETMEFGGVTDIEQSIKDDLAVLKASPYIRKELADRSVGYLYDLITGKLCPVDA